MVRESESEQVKRALDGTKRQWKGNPRVVEFQFNLGEDQTGDPSVFVTTLLDDATSDGDWTSANLDPIAQRCKEAIAEAGVERWVYVRFARPADLNDPGDN